MSNPTANIERPARVIVTWTDGLSTYEWPMATVDNRKSRVLARIIRWQIPCDPATIKITPVG